MKRTPPADLPPRYYLDHFETLLDWVEGQYPDLLSDDERDFIRRFRGLPEDGRCLFVRLANRRRRFFRRSALNYPEIGPLDTALARLESAGLARVLRPGVAMDSLTERAELLDQFTRPELLALARRLAPAVRGLSALKKPQLLERLLDAHPAPELLSAALDLEPVIYQACGHQVEMLAFLFFGNLHGGMERFVVRDLGLLRVEAFDTRQLTRYFETRQQALDKLAVARLAQRYHDSKERHHPLTLFHWFRDWLLDHGDLDPLALSGVERLALRLGRRLERAGFGETALESYVLADIPPARERRVRILHRLKRRDQALELAARMVESPLDPDEALFAADYLDRDKGQGLKRLTRVLKEAQTLPLSPAWRHRVEQGVLDHYQALGWQGRFTENHLWRGLFGLLLWDELFAEAMHHPLQTRPSDLYRPEFFARREAAIRRRLEILDDTDAALAELEHRFRRKQGIANPLVTWHEGLPDLCREALARVPAEVLREVLLSMARDLRHNASGFPDLLVWRGTDYAFIEVKSPTDTLSARQLRWLEFFDGQGMAARVARVVWAPDEPPAGS